MVGFPFVFKLRAKLTPLTIINPILVFSKATLLNGLKSLVYYPKPNNNKTYEGINIKHQATAINVVSGLSIIKELLLS